MQVLDGNVTSIDSKVVIQRCEYFLEGDRSLNRVLAQSIGGTDHLPSPHATSRHEGEGNLRPVVTAIHFVDLGCSTKLTPNNY